MVPTPLRPRIAARAAGLAAAGALSLSVGACGRADDAAGGTPAERIAAQVRAQYTMRDAVAAGAWTWDGPDGRTWVLVDMQSTVPELVQARVDLWVGDSAGVERVGRSDVMPSVAEFGAYEFDDITGDGIPDLLGYVADSAAVSYPVFIPGARGAMADVLEDAARGWRFATADDTPPGLVRGIGGVCALQLWAEEPPDSGAAGWRWLWLGRNGELRPPTSESPVCP